MTSQPRPHRLTRPVRSWATWGLGYGVARFFIHGAARGGDLISQLDTDPALREDPYAAYDELRARGQVVRGKVLHATAHHDVATEILRSDVFGVGGGHQELPGPLARWHERLADPWELGPVEKPSMLAVDAPEHTRYRRLVSRAFTARAVSGLETTIESIADRLLDDLAARRDRGEHVDLVASYAALLPVAVIADLLGVPERDRPDILRWANRAAYTLDPALSWRQYRGAAEDVRHLHRWFDGHVTNLRAAPGDDLLSRLAVLEGDDALTDVELHATGLLVLGAGFETTVNLIGNAVHQLAQHPEQLEVLRGDPTLWGGAVDEVLRYDSPVQLTMRMAYADTTVGDGVEVSRGTPVLTLLGAANRDPAVFDDPHTFDVRRANAGAHLAFSSGAHFCLGASLARREAEVGLRMLYERFPDLAATDAPVRRGTRVLRGYESMPVSLGGRVPVS